MTIDVNQALLDEVLELSRLAGNRILSIYERNKAFDVELKEDNSPLTEADLAANEVLISGLMKLTPNVPILSEEAPIPDFIERSGWAYYWLIDPLDGTKEFLSRNGEFTVNVALIHLGAPVLGVVYVPVKEVAYTGVINVGASRISRGREEVIRVRTLKSRIDNQLPVSVVASRRHGNRALQSVYTCLSRHFATIESKSVGSSLKLCMVAAGDADLYPRLAPTSEWDTAAGQAVVEAAGGHVLDTSWQTLRYNQKDDLTNAHFYAMGDSPAQWQRMLSSLCR